MPFNLNKTPVVFPTFNERNTYGIQSSDGIMGFNQVISLWQFTCLFSQTPLKTTLHYKIGVLQHFAAVRLELKLPKCQIVEYLLYQKRYHLTRTN